MTPFHGIILILYHKQQDKESSCQETQNLYFLLSPFSSPKTLLLSKWAERRTALVHTFKCRGVRSDSLQSTLLISISGTFASPTMGLTHLLCSLQVKGSITLDVNQPQS